MNKLILLLLLLPASVFASISSKILDNGLKVIVKSDNRSPIFISEIWYKVGSADEPTGLSGMSHLLEHMMFKGTNIIKDNEFSKIIAKNGGQDNAFTSYDYTAYYQKMHKSKLALALQMEADRMKNLQLNNNNFIKENLVVQEERRLRVEDNPKAKTWEKLHEIIFIDAYKTPVGGYMKDLKNMHLTDLSTWYNKYYAPNNATLVVVGDVAADEVFALAAKYFGNFESINLKKNKLKQGVIKDQHLELKLVAKLPFAILAFGVPSLNNIADDNKDIYALYVFAYLLDEMIAKNLVRKDKILASINVSYDIYAKYNTIFSISFTPFTGISFVEAKNAILKQIKFITTKKNNFTQVIKNINTQISSNFIYAQDSIDTTAYYLGKLATVGIDIKVLDEYPKNISTININDVVMVAKKYFNDYSSINMIPVEK